MNQKARKDSDASPSGNELCCCRPVARVWIETRSTATFVENKIDMRRRLQVRADANASIQPPGGPGVDADGSGGSELDEGTFKDQGKVYRIDEYTIHWKVQGNGDLQVSLEISGSVQYTADWLPLEGAITVCSPRVLLPHDYANPSQITATVSAQDCMKQSATCSNNAKIC
jgi:hypothetical protein